MSAFHTTRWSLILQARRDGPRAREALEELCRIYRPAVIAFARRHGYSPTDAEDLAQSFYADIIGRDFHALADPARGRFRSYLLTALRHFVANARAHDDAIKRGGRLNRVPLLEPDTSRDPQLVSQAESPEEAFDRAWAIALLHQAVERLDQETRRAGKSEWFRELRVFLMEDPDPEDYARLSQRLGVRANTIAVAVHRMRHRLRTQVMVVLKETVGDKASVEAELAHLKAALGAVEHRMVV